MSLRTTEIAAILTRWLQRYSPPNNIRENEKAQQDEVEALMRVIVRFAPQADYTPWVNRLTDQLDYQMKTRAWPTVGEVGAVCSNMRKEQTSDSPRDQASQPLDQYEIVGARMREGKPVGESFLYGREACELIARRLVTREVITAYRSGAFMARKAVQGEESALAWEADAKARHESARASRAETPQKRDTSSPDMNRVPEVFADA